MKATYEEEINRNGLQQFLFHETRYSLCRVCNHPDTKTLTALEQFEDPVLGFIKDNSDQCVDFSHPCVFRVFENYPQKGQRSLDFYFGGSLEDVRSCFYEMISLYDRAHRYIIAYGVSKAVEYIHSLNLTHKDIRPENVVLDHNLYPYLKVYQTGDNIFKLGYVSYPYVAPEAYNDQKATKMSDIWMLGSLIFELFAEEKPFQDHFATDFSDIKECRLIIAGTIRKMTRTNFPDEREALLQKKLEKNPNYNSESEKFGPKYLLKYRNGVRPKKEIMKGHALRDLVEKCFDFDPNKRPQANFISDEIERIGKIELSSEPDQLESFVKYLEYVKPRIERREKPEIVGTYENMEIAIERNLPFALYIKGVLVFYEDGNGPKNDGKKEGENDRRQQEMINLLRKSRDLGFEDAYICLSGQFEEEINEEYENGFFQEILI